jgi:hypothetical protein
LWRSDRKTGERKIQRSRRTLEADIETQVLLVSGRPMPVDVGQRHCASLLPDVEIRSFRTGVNRFFDSLGVTTLSERDMLNDKGQEAIETRGDGQAGT